MPRPRSELLLPKLLSSISPPQVLRSNLVPKVNRFVNDHHANLSSFRMAQLYQWVCLLFICLLSVPSKTEARINVTLTVVESAKSKGAVCIDGSPPGYYHHEGDTDNWVIFLEGGGWCLNATNCKYRAMGNLGSSKYMPPLHELGNLLSENPNENPDFYNWHRVYVAYCDGSSYTSDVNEVDPATNLTYRGAKIFDALMEEFKAKGMRMAKNAIFAGNSAGGVAVMLHCDRFRAHFPNTTRVKCLADSSYFIDDQKLDGDKVFQSSFEFLVGSMGSAKWLPQQCTSRMKPSLCFFPQNSLQYVNTPIFLTMSAFDQTQLKYGLSMSHEVCVINNNCTLNEMKRVKDLRLDFLSLLPKTKSESMAIWVNNCISHEFTYFSWYGPTKLKLIGNKTYEEVFADWYFDRNNAASPIRIIDQCDKPVDCSAFDQHPRKP